MPILPAFRREIDMRVVMLVVMAQKQIIRLLAEARPAAACCAAWPRAVQQPQSE